MNLKKKKKVALVLGGGGVKAAAFHVGVCLALQEKGFQLCGGDQESFQRLKRDETKIPISTYVGSSAGSIISSYLAAGYSINAIIEAFRMSVDIKAKPQWKQRSYLKPLSYRDVFQINEFGLNRYLPKKLFQRPLVMGGIEVLLKRGVKLNGLFHTRGIERHLREDVLPVNHFSELGSELYVIATQLNHSRKVVFGDFEETKKFETIKWANFASISQAVAASTSLPPLYSPYPIRTHVGKELYFTDGEISDTLSSHVAEDRGADLVIASYIIQPYHFTKEVGSLSQFGIPVILNQMIYQMVHQKIQGFIREKKKYKQVLSEIHHFLDEYDIPISAQKKLIDSICNTIEHNESVDYIYIHPSPNNYEFFFLDHFSFSPKILGKIVKTGFVSTMRSLRNHKI